LRAIREGWGTQEFSDDLLKGGCSTLYASEEDRSWFANWLRVGATPAVAYELRAFFETDLRNVLPAIHVPTLVLYRSNREDIARAHAIIDGAKALDLEVRAGIHTGRQAHRGPDR
jgi:pimeloyl-ACP methyl ester carboxylesterase